MNYIYCNGELYHYGVKGMKWGVRKKPEVLNRISGRIKKSKENEKAYRDKLSAIQNKQSSYTQKVINGSDLERFKYRNQSLAKRVSKTAGKIIAGKLVGDLVAGNIGIYGTMSKAQLAKELGSVALKTAATVAAKDALAKSASKRYNEEGQKTKKSGTFLTGTKEDMIEGSVKTVIQMAPMFAMMGKLKMVYAERQRAQNEAKFKSWGQNILSEKAGVITLSDSDWKELN